MRESLKRLQVPACTVRPSDEPSARSGSADPFLRLCSFCASGAPDPELHAKIALLQQTLDSRDTVVKDTVDKMENGGIAQVLRQVSSWEQQAAAAERDLQDPEVQSILSAAGPLLGAHFALPDGSDREQQHADDGEEGSGKGAQTAGGSAGRYTLQALSCLFPTAVSLGVLRA